MKGDLWKLLRFYFDESYIIAVTMHGEDDEV